MAQTTIVSNTTSVSTSMVTVRSDEWSTGICDCCSDMSVCCFACWCCPCFACSTASDFGECFCLPLLDLCNPTYTPAISMAMRVAVRNRYGIQGEMVGDCIYTIFCTCCSCCQIAREIKKRKAPTHVITAQPVLVGGPQYMVASQPAFMAIH